MANTKLQYWSPFKIITYTPILHSHWWANECLLLIHVKNWPVIIKSAMYVLGVMPNQSALKFLTYCGPVMPYGCINLTAPCHYLNRRRLIIEGFLWYSPERIFIISFHEPNPQDVYWDWILKSQPHLPGANELMQTYLKMGIPWL